MHQIKRLTFYLMAFYTDFITKNIYIKHIFIKIYFINGFQTYRNFTKSRYIDFKTKII
jgi:hypothetical protein